MELYKLNPKEIRKRRVKREAERSQNKCKAENKRVEIIQNISIITINISGQS